MDINFAQISAATVAVLSPFMPYLVEAGKRFSGKAGEAAWTKAKRVWDKIWANFGDDPEIEEAGRALSADPEKELAQERLAQALALRLTDKLDLAQEILKTIGGQDAIQQVLAERGSLVENVKQHLEGKGKQIVRATDHGTISGVEQIKK